MELPSFLIIQHPFSAAVRTSFTERPVEMPLVPDNFNIVYTVHYMVQNIIFVDFFFHLFCFFR
jgi:hypothetical protein